MEQLLKITTIPLEYQLKIQNARLEYSNSTASLDMDRTPGEFSIKSRPAKLNLDTYEARNSVVPTLKRSLHKKDCKRHNRQPHNMRRRDNNC